jgi:hypothetical protein
LGVDARAGHGEVGFAEFVHDCFDESFGVELSVSSKQTRFPIEMPKHHLAIYARTVGRVLSLNSP